WPPCPRTAPRGQVGAMSISGASMGVALLPAGHKHYNCGLVVGKRRPLWADHRQASPLVG
ncbi:hypothetical protein BHE74_00048931, partial [Ensete ventricosum]